MRIAGMISRKLFYIIVKSPKYDSLNYFMWNWLYSVNWFRNDISVYLLIMRSKVEISAKFILWFHRNIQFQLGIYIEEVLSQNI